MARLSVLEKLEKLFEYILGWFDVLYAFGVVSFLIWIAKIYWPLSNDDSQILIFLVTAFTLFFQAAIGFRPYKYRNRPIVDVEFNEKESGSFHKTMVTIDSRKLDNNQTFIHQAQIPTYFIRLKVFNKGKDILKNAEAVIEDVKPKQQRPFLPLSLNWSFLKETEFGLARFARVPQNMFRTLDLFEIYDPQKLSIYGQYLEENGYSDAERYLELSKGFRSCTLKPTALSDIYPCDEYEFCLSIYAENAKPLFIKISLSYHDKKSWDDNTGIMRKRLSIELQKSSKRSYIFVKS